MRFLAACLLLLATAVSAWPAPPAAREAVPAPAEVPWNIPGDEEIRQALAERLRIKGAGMVVGVIEPAGRRVIAYGSSGTKYPLDGDAIFQIGSVSKPFVSLLLADMVVRGEVKLDDPAAKYLPAGVRMPERGRPITLQDLALHVSGLPFMPTNYRLDADPDPHAAYSPKLLHEFLATHELDREPGAKWVYSSLGVSLLGRLLAQRAGGDYEKLLMARVLQPLGLRSTAITLTRAQARRAASGIDRHGNPAVIWERRTLVASGSMRSSANDLLEFLSLYLGLRETSLNRAVALQLSTRSAVQSAQALGWGIGKVDGREIFAHEGGMPGFRSYVAFDPVKQRGIVILVNANTEERLGSVAVWLMLGAKLPAVREPSPRTRVMLEQKVLDAYQGRYQLESGRVLTVICKRDHLITENTAGGPLLFLPSSERDFFEPAAGEELSFTVDQENRVTGVQVYPRGREAGGAVVGTRLADPP